jgi:hypothetical protein
MSGDEYTIDLKTASLMMKMPQPTVLKCVSYMARKLGKKKLPVKSRNGVSWFRKEDIEAYLEDLAQPWVSSKDEARPPIPDFFKDYLRLETRLHCGVCGKPFATDFAHIEDYARCLHNHPWNLLCTCSECHTAFDNEKRISIDEMRWAKRRAESEFQTFLQNVSSEDRLLKRLSRISISINGTVATGIDFLLSAYVPGKCYLDVTKLRVVNVLQMLGTGEMDADPITTFSRLMELPLLSLESGHFCDPLGEERAITMYEHGLHPDLEVNLNVLGESLLDYLLDHADEYVDTRKYRDYSSLTARELVGRVAEHLGELQARRDMQDKVGILELNTFSY